MGAARDFACLWIRGVIIEEVGTAAVGSDSYYVDRRIAKLPRENRKTRLLNWEASV